MAGMFQSGDHVCLEVGKQKRDLLFAPVIARWMAANLEEFSGYAAVSQPLAAAGLSPSVCVSVITNRQRVQIRLQFSSWSPVFFFTVPHALELAKILRHAADQAEAKLNWKEERDPQVLLK